MGSPMTNAARPLAARFARPLRDGLILVGLGRAAYYYIVQAIHPWEFAGVDARAYWGIDLAHPYAASGVGVISTYLYSPAFAQVMAPFSLLPFGVFFALWTAMNLALFVWLVRPRPWVGLALFLPVTYELFVGNVHFLIAAAIVLAFRRPATLALPILTKITPGISVLWFAVRREWRAVAEVTLITAAIVAISFALAPSAWFDWVTLLTSNAERGQLLLPRVALGVVLVAVGALTDRRWLVPVAVWIAIPVVWINAWVILLATIRLSEPSDRAG
jgi:Glycosyltransferase family 87